MKVDITTVIIAAIVGIVLAYFFTDSVILQSPSQITIKTLDDSTSAELAAPSAEVFNYRALNPTVEVYIDCTNYDASGSCKDVVTGDN